MSVFANWSWICCTKNFSYEGLAAGYTKLTMCKQCLAKSHRWNLKDTLCKTGIWDNLWKHWLLIPTGVNEYNIRAQFSAVHIRIQEITAGTPKGGSWTIRCTRKCGTSPQNATHYRTMTIPVVGSFLTPQIQFLYFPLKILFFLWGTGSWRMMKLGSIFCEVRVVQERCHL